MYLLCRPCGCGNAKGGLQTTFRAAVVESIFGAKSHNNFLPFPNSLSLTKSIVRVIPDYVDSAHNLQI